MDQRKDIQSERPGSSDDSDSICSFTHSSYNSLSEGSYELAPWKGKLSMSWESIGPDVISSSLLLAPDNTGWYLKLLMGIELSYTLNLLKLMIFLSSAKFLGNISDEASTFSDISTTSITGAISENPRPPAFKYFAYSGAPLGDPGATGASSSSTSMPEDQQNPTTISIDEDSITSEGE